MSDLRSLTLDPEVLGRLRRISEVSGQSLDRLVDDALRTHVQRLAGQPDDPPATEFRKMGSDRRAQAVLRQDTDLGFVVVEPLDSVNP